MIGGQGKLFGRTVTSFIASTWRWLIGDVEVHHGSGLDPHTAGTELDQDEANGDIDG
jgi:hypothetical protein